MVMLAACAEPDYPTALPIVTTQTVKVTTFHAIAGGARLQMKIDNVATAKDTLRYEAKNGKFYNSINLTVPAGPFRLVTASTLADGTDLSVDRNTMVAGTNYSSFVITRIQKVNNVDTPVPAIRRITDNLTAADVGFAKVRFLHFALDAPEIKVTDVGNVNTIFSARKYDEVTRGSADFTVFSSLTAGTYTFEVRSTADNSLLLNIPSVKLDSKSVYTIYLRGLVAGNGDTELGYTVFKH
jgi:hypothetical protein